MDWWLVTRIAANQFTWLWCAETVAKLVPSSQCLPHDGNNIVPQPINKRFFAILSRCIWLGRVRLVTVIVLLFRFGTSSIFVWLFGFSCSSVPNSFICRTQFVCTSIDLDIVSSVMRSIRQTTTSMLVTVRNLSAMFVLHVFQLSCQIVDFTQCACAFTV